MGVVECSGVRCGAVRCPSGKTRGKSIKLDDSSDDLCYSVIIKLDASDNCVEAVLVDCSVRDLAIDSKGRDVRFGM